MPSRMMVEQIPMMGLCSSVAMVQPPGLQQLQQLAQILNRPSPMTYIGNILGH